MMVDRRYVTSLEPREYDVLCGKDNNLDQTRGNQLFRQILFEFLAEYRENTVRSDRARINSNIIATMKTRYGSRFIAKKWNKITGSNYWEELSEDKIKDKVSHA
jgi:hypothetical protein